MTTVVVVNKDGQVAIAADALVTFGDTRLPHGYEANEKMFSIGDARISAWPAAAAHFLVLRRGAGRHLADELQARQQGRGLRHLSAAASRCSKDNFFLQPKEDENDPYESSAVHRMLIANASGIYGVYRYREVFEFKQFWGIGSGRSFALGAMHAAYDKRARRARSGRGRRRRRLRVRQELGAPLRVFSFRTGTAASGTE